VLLALFINKGIDILRRGEAMEWKHGSADQRFVQTH